MVARVRGDRTRWRKVFSEDTLEKVALVSMVSIAFAQVLPNVQATPLQLSLAVGVVVVVSLAVSTWLGLRSDDWPSALREFAVMSALNVGLILAAAYLLGRRGNSLELGNAIFLVLLLTPLTTLFDRYDAIRDAGQRLTLDTPGTRREGW